jgi:hypothetical protein
MIRLLLLLMLTAPTCVLAADPVPSEEALYAAARALPMPRLARKLRSDAALFRAGKYGKASVAVVKPAATRVTRTRRARIQ